MRAWVRFSTLQKQLEKTEAGKDLACGGETEQSHNLFLAAPESQPRPIYLERPESFRVGSFTMTIKWSTPSLSQRGNDGVQTQCLLDFPGMLPGAGDVKKTICLQLSTSQSMA